MARTDQKAAAGKKQVIVIAQGGGIAFAGSLLLLFLASFLILKGWFPLTSALKLSVASCALSGFFSTLLTGRRLKGGTLAAFLAIGLLQFALFLLLGLFFVKGMAPGMEQLPLFAACLCSCGLGGLLTAKKGKKKRRP